jgi:hypothetical protein
MIMKLIKWIVNTRYQFQLRIYMILKVGDGLSIIYHGSGFYKYGGGEVIIYYIGSKNEDLNTI